jgi:hypothetical protein
VLCLLASPILLMGPQTTWAAFQSWLGFVPGFGFAELDRVRVLAEPAAIEVDDLTVEITQVVVHEATQLTFKISGFPETESPGRRFYEIRDHVDVALTLASGETLTPTDYLPYYATRASMAWLVVFSPLAPREEQARLRIVTDAEMPVPGLRQRRIEIPFKVVPGDAEAVADRFPVSYQPATIADAAHDITLSVSNVAYGEASMSLEMVWDNASPWEFRGGSWPDYVVDQNNHFLQPDFHMLPANVISQKDRSPGEVLPLTVSFPAPAPDAEMLTLTVSRVSVYTDVAPLPITFAVDLGEAPEHGQVFPVNAEFRVAGFDYALQDATYVLVEEVDDRRVNIPYETVAALYIGVETEARRNDLSFNALEAAVQHHAFAFSSTATTDPVKYRYQPYTVLYFDAVPTGVVPVRIEGVSYSLRGPWQVTWRVPEATTSPQP